MCLPSQFTYELVVHTASTRLQNYADPESCITLQADQAEVVSYPLDSLQNVTGVFRGETSQDIFVHSLPSYSFELSFRIFLLSSSC